MFLRINTWNSCTGTHKQAALFFSFFMCTYMNFGNVWSFCVGMQKNSAPVLRFCLLLCGLFYEAVCFISCLVLFCSCVFSVLLALRLPRLRKRELVLVLFVRLFDLCLFGFVGFLFLLVSGKGCGL